MKAFVITVENIKESVQAAERCINSASRNGFIVNKHFGVTPEDDPVKLFEDKGLPTKNFENNKYSRYERCYLHFYLIDHFGSYVLKIKEITLY